MASRVARRFFCVLAVAALAMSARADQVGDWRFSGFANIGVTRGDSATLGFRREISQDKASFDGQWRADLDSSLGLQLNWRLSTRCDAAFQLLIKLRREADIDDYAEWAYLRCRAGDNHSFRVGRLGLDIFMLSDYRPVAYAYPWLRPPHDFYAFLALNHFDGVDYRYRRPWGDGQWQFSVFAGQSQTDNLPSGDDSFVIRAQPINGVQLAYDTEIWRVSLNHTTVEFDSGPPVAPLVAAADGVALFGWLDAAVYARELVMKGSSVSYDALGWRYDNNDWLAQVEWARLNGERDILPRADHQYASLGRRFAAWTLTATVGRIRPREAPNLIEVPAFLPPLPALQQLAQGLSAAMVSSRSEQQSWSLGLRWDFAAKQALKLEYDHFRVEPYGAGLWQSDTPLTERESVNVVSLQWQRVF